MVAHFGLGRRCGLGLSGLGPTFPGKHLEKVALCMRWLQRGQPILPASADGSEGTASRRKQVEATH